MTQTTNNSAPEWAEQARHQVSPGGTASATRRNLRKRLAVFAIPALIIAVLATLPYIGLSLPGVLPGPINSPTTMQLLALCLVTAGVAISYEMLFGRTGLMSFGHALFVGAGAYTVAILLGKVGAGIMVTVLVTLLVGVVLPLIVGAIALRVQGIAFAMVTLAFAEVAAIAVAANFGQMTGGENGLGLVTTQLPPLLVGIVNAPYRYWMALAFLALAWAAMLYLDNNRIGRAWAAVRENEKRVEVLGISTFRARLLAMVIAGLLGTIGGVLQLLLISSANPSFFSLGYSLELLIIIVLGGVGSKYGAVIGAFIYVLLDNRLLEVSNSEWVGQLPPALSIPLSEPHLLIGVIFIFFVFFVRGGISSIPSRIRRSRRHAAAKSGRQT